MENLPFSPFVIIGRERDVEDSTLYLWVFYSYLMFFYFHIRQCENDRILHNRDIKILGFVWMGLKSFGVGIDHFL